MYINTLVVWYTTIILPSNNIVGIYILQCYFMSIDSSVALAYSQNVVIYHVMKTGEHVGIWSTDWKAI